MAFKVPSVAAFGLSACLLLAASPAMADRLAELDALSQATDDTASGLALARQLSADGDLLGAMATVERLLINHPESDEALLMHASLLCRVGDRTGSEVDFAWLRRRDFPREVWADAVAPCRRPPRDAGDAP